MKKRILITLIYLAIGLGILLIAFADFKCWQINHPGAPIWGYLFN